VINRISNPIYSELLNLKLVKKGNIVKISNKTRDKDIKVFQDKISKIIFLEKAFSASSNPYITKSSDMDRIHKKSQVVELSKKKISIDILDDDSRRYSKYKDIIKNKIILDFGCGWGTFLLKAKKAKRRYGVELRRDCKNYINKLDKSIFVEDTLEKFKKKFDVIVLFHALEHLTDQVGTIKKLRNRLSSKGKLIIEVPHAEDILLNLKSFRDFSFFSEHLILHTKDSLKKILQKAGFNKVKIQYTQRYNLENHLGWFLKNKPGGHKIFKNLCEPELLKIYNKFIINNRMSDTLTAIITK
jgi:2-polyprenyl-3-methyl-5-hydroxy-6-metoxy-1,4-benzoquinol methylase